MESHATSATLPASSTKDTYSIYQDTEDDDDHALEQDGRASVLLTPPPQAHSLRQLWTALQHRQFCEPPGRARVSSEEESVEGSWTLLGRACAQHTKESTNDESTTVKQTHFENDTRHVSFVPPPTEHNSIVEEETEAHYDLMDDDHADDKSFLPLEEDSSLEEVEPTVLLVEVEELPGIAAGWQSWLEHMLVAVLLLWALAHWMTQHLGMQCQILLIQQ